MIRAFLLIISLVTLSACNPTESDKHSDVDPNLECAALISAASYIIAKGDVGSDFVLSENDGLVSLMTYLNTYAIPKGLKEPEAFQELENQREKLTSSVPSSEILDRAKKCMENIPQQTR